MTLDTQYDEVLDAPAFGPDEVAAISTDVWACFLGAGDEFFPAGEPAEIGADAYVASVGITGTWTGHIILELPSPAAERAARLMIGSDTVSPEDVTDAVGELVNMVGGNLKGLVPAPSALGLPLVFKGAGAPAAGHDIVSISTSDFDWVGQPVRVSVWESSQPETEK